MPPEIPKFGDLKSQKEARTRPRTKKEVIPTEYDPLKVLPTIERLVVREIERWEILRREGLDRGTLAREILGTETKPIHPSLVSKCLRWWGYSKLGYKPLSKEFNAILRLKAGSAIHQAFEDLLKMMGPTEYHIIRSEEDDPEMTGTLDILFKNPRLPLKFGNFQVIELKSVSTEAFKYQLNRKKLRRDLILVKGIVAPRESDKKQVGLYLKQLEDEGKRVASANIIYIDRNNLDIKEALIPWDPITQYEVNQFIEEIEEANQLIERGELPQPTVDSDIPCRYYCDYRHVCDVRAVAKRRVRKPSYVYKKARKEREKRRKIMEKLGSVQPTLGGDFEDLIHKKK